jgi:hypothetical protein
MGHYSLKKGTTDSKSARKIPMNLKRPFKQQDLLKNVVLLPSTFPFGLANKHWQKKCQNDKIFWSIQI